MKKDQLKLSLNKQTLFLLEYYSIRKGKKVTVEEIPDGSYTPSGCKVGCC